MAPAAVSATATSPWGTAGAKVSLVVTAIDSLGGPWTSTVFPESVSVATRSTTIAVSLVEEGGGIDRMTRVYAVRAVDRERLCSGRRDGGERRAANLVWGWGVQLLAFNTEEYRSSGVRDRSPAEQDTITSHLAGQPGELSRTGPGSAVSRVRRAGRFPRMVTQGNLIAQKAVRTPGEVGRQCVRVCPSCSGRQVEASDVCARPAFDRPANLNRDRVLESDTVRGPRGHGPGQVNGVADPNRGEIHDRHWQVEAWRLRCGGCSAANHRARQQKRQSGNQELAIHALPT